jgi:hypothetical protein
MHCLKKGYKLLCDLVSSPPKHMAAAVKNTLDTAEAMLEADMPQHPTEQDLSPLSDEELRELCGPKQLLCDEAACLSSLKNMRGFRDGAKPSQQEVDLGRAHKFIEQCRARLTLLKREKNGNRWRAHTVRMRSTACTLCVGSGCIDWCAAGCRSSRGSRHSNTQLTRSRSSRCSSSRTRC